MLQPSVLFDFRVVSYCLFFPQSFNVFVFSPKRLNETHPDSTEDSIPDSKSAFFLFFQILQPSFLFLWILFLYVFVFFWVFCEASVFQLFLFSFSFGFFLIVFYFQFFDFVFFFKLCFLCFIFSLIYGVLWGILFHKIKVIHIYIHIQFNCIYIT